MPYYIMNLQPVKVLLALRRIALLPSTGSEIECEKRHILDVYPTVNVHVKPWVVPALADGRAEGECYLSHVEDCYTAVPCYARLLPEQNALLHGRDRAVAVGHIQGYVMIARSSEGVAYESTGRAGSVVEAP